MKSFVKIVSAIAALCVICAGTVSACPECRARVRSAIYNQDFSVHLVVILLPLLVLTATGMVLYYADQITAKFKEGLAKWHRKERAAR